MDEYRLRQEAAYLALQLLTMQAQRPDEPAPTIDQLLNYADKIRRFIEAAK